MKNFFLLLSAALLMFGNAYATSIHISTTSSFTYSPASVSASVGDTVTIEAESFHPLVQVDLATWTANGNTPLSGGWGTKTADYTFIITTVGDIYFVCGNHHGSGMKGMISVLATGIQSASPVMNFRLYPNPLSGNEIYVDAPKNDFDGTLLIYNAEGKMMRKQEITSEPAQPISLNLPAGIYLYRFFNGREYSPAELLTITR